METRNKNIDWEERRFELAKAAMLGYISSPSGLSNSDDFIAKRALHLADSLLSLLKP